MGLESPAIIPIHEELFILAEDYVYEWIKDDQKTRLKIPKGFRFDGASVPRFLWWWLPPIADYMPAVVVHDYLYQNGPKQLPYGVMEWFSEKDGEWFNVWGVWKRKDVDILFRKMLKQCGIPGFKRRMMFYAVHYFGEGNF